MLSWFRDNIAYVYIAYVYVLYLENGNVCRPVLKNKTKIQKTIEHSCQSICVLVCVYVYKITN